MALRKLKQPTICNSKGEPVKLTREESWLAEYLQRQINEKFQNSLGYEVNITTLTTILKKISEQKFFEVAPADYLPVVVGQGAWSSNLTAYRSFEIGDDFETGIMNTGGQNSRQASVDAGVDALNIKAFPWAKSMGWSIFDLEFAAKSGNWDLVSGKEKARKRNWDLGIQRIAFLGARGQNAANGNCLGLLNQPGITINTSVITQPINQMSPTDLKQFVAVLIESYRNNCQRTAWPDLLTIPESDYNGLSSQASAQFPIKSTLELLEEAFKLTTRNKNFRIMPLAYGDAAYHSDVASIAGQQVYTLSRMDEESLVMNVPVPYTNTLANSLDNFNFQNSGYGQFTGVLTLRPLELMYYQFPSS